MVFQVKADLVKLLEALIASLQPFAQAHEVDLHFESQAPIIIAYYQPEGIIPDVTQLLSRVITFTPQSYQVRVCLERPQKPDQALRLTVTNTGVNLTRMREICAGIRFKTEVRNTERDGTCFQMELPLSNRTDQQKKREVSNTGQVAIPAYYSMIRDRLTTHYKNIENLEVAADQKNEKEGIFLKKVNAIITSHLDQSEFKAEALARAVALSRTQLHRKIKSLTAMSPGRYIQYFRLQKAKLLLEIKDLNVSEVAFRVGFVSNSHFTRAFQKEFGFKPSSFK